MAESVQEALRKSKYLPIHEVFLHSGWFDKIAGQEFFQKNVSDKVGFHKVKEIHKKESEQS